MKRTVLALVQSCGGFALARALSAKAARILMYHNFSPAGETGSDAVNTQLARSHLEYLRRHFRVVPLAHIVDQLTSDKPLDDLAVAITIDDGRRNCFEFFFPLLKEFAMPATIFVVSSFIRREDWVWTDKVLWLSEQPARPAELSPRRISGFFELLNRMQPDSRNSKIAALATEMCLQIPTEPPPKYAPCSWAELREMADSGLVEIGSHTVTHSILAGLTDEESWHELTVSRTHIQAGLGRKARFFCIPNGKTGDYKSSHIKQIDDAGYSAAVVARFGLVPNGSNVYELPRMGISGDSDPTSFAKILDGVETYQLGLRRALGGRGALV